MRAQLVLVSVPRLPLEGVRSMSPGPDFRGADWERCVSYFTLLWWSKNTLSAIAGAANDVYVVSDAQAIFCRRRHQPRRPPPAKIRPGRPAPTTGPGTGAGDPVTTRVRWITLPEGVPG